MDSDSSKAKGLKACSACASAKVRCDIAAGQTRCKRCDRLDKGCSAQPRGSHSRKSIKKYGKDDFLRLESKFETVAQLLSTPSPLPPARPGNTSDKVPIRASNTIPPPSAESHLYSLFTQPLPPETLLAAYSMLELYRQEMMSLFPFVFISLDESPEKLFRERPVLYMAIMVVACQQDVQVQQDLAQRWREEFSRRLWVRGETSLQLLQGLLVYLACNLMHTAMSLVTELGLDKEPLSSSNTAPGALDDVTYNQITRAERTHEERRCYLGAYWTNSLLRMCVKDMIAMPSKPSIDEGCLVLERDMQFPSDIYLVHLVRVQQVANSVSATLYQDLDDHGSNASSTTLMAVSHLEKEIEKVRATFRPGLPHQPLLMMSYYLLQIYLYKIGMDDGFNQPESTNTSLFVAKLSHLLVSCLGAVKALIDVFLSLANSIILSIPYPNWIQMGHSIFVFSRLLITHRSFWEPGILTDVPDFIASLERISNKIDAAMNQGMHLSPPRSLPAVFSKMRERLIDISRKVEESSRTNTRANIGVEGASASDVLDPSSTVMDEQTETLLYSFFAEGGLM
ncbi:hypothetical protein FZEAL_8549 [Fusarium zealandicum]|uniref:Zn(2)-C6 fungal-type domain-containing protein n=1 Tax=Fusarium zealandicum TaxID=1053134 RepID=A0A8H4UDK9_9HYPO|nr:hypothetical protein FZEAL_8549 [Fusarium zealandicum]